MEMTSRLPKHIRFLLLGCFVNCLFSFAFPMMSLVVSGGNKDAIGYLPWMMSAAYLMSAIAQPKIGPLLDQGFTSPVVKLATTCACAGMAGLFLFEGFIMPIVLSLGMIVLGLSVLSLVGSKIIEGQVDAELRSKTSLLLSGIGNLGFGFSALLAYFYLNNHKGLLLLLDGVSTAIYAAMLIKLEQPSPNKDNVGGNNGKSLAYQAEKLTLIQICSLGSILCFFVAMVAPFSTVPLQYQIQSQDYERLTPVMFGVNNTVVFLTSLFILNKIGKFSVQTLSLSSAIFLGLGLMLVPMVTTQLQNIFVTTLWSVGEVLAYPVIARTIFENFQKGSEGRAAGYKVALLRLAFVLAPALIGIIRWSEGRLFSFTFGIIPVLGFFLLWIFTDSKKQPLQAVSQT